MRFLHLPTLLFLTLTCVNAQKNPLVTRDSTEQRQWVDMRYDAMDIDEKLGQLFMVMIASDQSKKDFDYIESLIEKGAYRRGHIFYRRSRSASEPYQSISVRI